MDRRCGRSTCTKRSFFRPQRRSKKHSFLRPPLWTVDWRKTPLFLIAEARGDKCHNVIFVFGVAMGVSNCAFFVLFAQFLRTTLDALVDQNPTNEKRLDALTGQVPTCRLYHGPLWTPCPVTIPQIEQRRCVIYTVATTPVLALRPATVRYGCH